MKTAQFFGSVGDEQVRLILDRMGHIRRGGALLPADAPQETTARIEAPIGGVEVVVLVCLASGAVLGKWVSGDTDDMDQATAELVRQVFASIESALPLPDYTRISPEQLHGSVEYFYEDHQARLRLWPSGGNSVLLDLTAEESVARRTIAGFAACMEPRLNEHGFTAKP